MNILAINSSYRGDKGYSKILIDKIFEGAKKKGAECETLILSNLKINPCIGCFSCQNPHSLHRCIFDGKDDVRMIYDKMKWADIIIYSTPVYIFSMSVLLRSLMDRFVSTSNVFQFQLTNSRLLFHHIDREICCKPFVTLINYDNSENETCKNIISYFKTYSRFMDTPQVGTIIRRSSMLVGHGKDPTKEAKHPVIYDIYTSLVQAGEELATYGRIKASTQRKASRKILKLPPFLKQLMLLKPFREEVQRKASECMKNS